MSSAVHSKGSAITRPPSSGSAARNSPPTSATNIGTGLGGGAESSSARRPSAAASADTAIRIVSVSAGLREIWEGMVAAGFICSLLACLLLDDGMVGPRRVIRRVTSSRSPHLSEPLNCVRKALALDGGCRINPRPAHWLRLTVGSEDGHLVRPAQAVRREVATHSCSRAHCREHAQLFRGLCATASTRVRCLVARDAGYRITFGDSAMPPPPSPAMDLPSWRTRHQHSPRASSGIDARRRSSSRSASARWASCSSRSSLATTAPPSDTSLSHRSTAGPGVEARRSRRHQRPPPLPFARPTPRARVGAPLRRRPASVGGRIGSARVCPRKHHDASLATVSDRL